MTKYFCKNLIIWQISSILLHRILIQNINIKQDILLQFLLGMSLQLMLVDLNYFNFLNSQTFNIGISAKNKVQKIGYAGSERGNNEGWDLTPTDVFSYHRHHDINCQWKYSNEEKNWEIFRKMARKTKFSESEVEKLVHVYNKITVSRVNSYFPKPKVP